MPIIVYCKSCAKKIRVPEGPAGRKGKCPQCNATILIPSESESEPPEVATKTPAEALEPVADEKAPPAKPAQPEPEPKAEPRPDAPKAKESEPKSAPKPVAAAGKKKPARIALQMDPTDAEDPLKAKRVALEAAKKEEAKDPGATTEELPKSPLKPVAKPGPRNLKQINWAEEPEPVKKTNPLLWVLLALIVLGLGLVAFKYLTKPDPNRLSPEDRKRQQFQIEPNADGWKDLRGGSKPK